MVETNWRAVGIGFVVIAALGVVGAYVEQLAVFGTVLGSVVGGFAAGYFAREGTANGAWNGLLAGAIGALVLVAVLVALGLAVSVVTLSLGGVFATIGVAFAAVVLIGLAAIPAAIGGAVGGMMTRDDRVETGRPAA
jgi:hypothetical protein